jgi:hypothetical protein
MYAQLASRPGSLSTTFGPDQFFRRSLADLKADGIGRSWS